MDSEMMQKEKNSSVALTRYGQLLSYLQYENTTYWTRAGFLLIAQAALFGFVVQILPPFSATCANWDEVGVCIVMGVAGLVLSRIWWNALRTAEDWIDRWHKRLIDLEPEAFGDMELFRGVVTPGVKSDPKKHGARAIADKVVWFFVVLWLGVVLYGFAVGVNKMVAI